LERLAAHNDIGKQADETMTFSEMVIMPKQNILGLHRISFRLTDGILDSIELSRKIL
jgi:hypothetical protein